MKKIAISILSQIIPVMIGVYLGFAMNNFGEQQKLKQQTSVYKEILKNEITENLKAIQSVSAYHIQLTEDISSLLEQKNLVEAFGSMSFQGFRPGFVSNSAFDTGIQTGIIQELDLKMVQSINKLYTLQGKYNRHNENLISSFVANKFPETESEIKSTMFSVRMSMNDVVIYEKELVKFYEILLKKF